MTVTTPDSFVDDSLAKRNALLLALAQAIGGASASIVIATAPLVGYSMLDTDKSLATLPVSAMVLGTAFGTIPAGMPTPPPPLTPVYSLAIAPENRNDEVKLTGSLQRIHQEDPSVSYQQNDDTHEMVLKGQGEIHLQIALEKLSGRYKIATDSSRPTVPYKETIQKPVSQHGRFKRQTGGHEQADNDVQWWDFTLEHARSPTERLSVFWRSGHALDFGALAPEDVHY